MKEKIGLISLSIAHVVFIKPREGASGNSIMFLSADVVFSVIAIAMIV